MARNIWSKVLIGPQPNEIIGAVKRDDFQSDFIFGSATSAYQVEGAAEEGGRGQSVWDSWTHQRPEKITGGANGAVAINHYRLYKEDVKRMKKIGFEGYRFSISWPRILPGGRLSTGINKDGIKFYNDLIDALMAEGIEPCATIFHWDLPLPLELEYGGLLSDKFVNDFVEFAELCFWEFGDRVKHWITFNEPWTYCTYGYVQGTFPPGRGIKSPPENSTYTGVVHKGCGVRQACSEGNPGVEPYLAAHNLLLAHANAVDVYRKQFQAKQGGKIGITNVSNFFEPYNDTNEDRDAAIRALDWMLGWFVAPIVTGDYPPSMRKSVGERLPKFSPDEAKLIKGSYDFLGLNYYTSWYALNTPKQTGQEPTYLSDQEVTTPTSKDDIPIGELAGTAWLAIVPRGIYNLLVYVKETYKISEIYITENGVTELDNTGLTLSKARFDPVRVKYFNDHLWYIKRAIKEAGVNVKAYFLWSFADNFEWADGYTQRFGIFYVMMVDGKFARYPKSSALWWMNFFNSKSITAGPLKREAKEIENERDTRKRTRSNN